MEEIVLTAITNFLNLCADYLSDDISGEEFKESFEIYMFDFGDDIEDEVYLLLDNILEAVTYFDASDFREDDEHYLAEDELRATVEENFAKIKALL